MINVKIRVVTVEYTVRLINSRRLMNISQKKILVSRAREVFFLEVGEVNETIKMH